jgi:hypothetical protein
MNETEIIIIPNDPFVRIHKEKGGNVYFSYKSLKVMFMGSDQDEYTDINDIYKVVNSICTSAKR